MQANSELLEAIQQKVELSEQLEQWQVMKMHIKKTAQIMNRNV